MAGVAISIGEIYTLDKGFDHNPDVNRVFDELRIEEGYKNFKAKISLKR